MDGISEYKVGPLTLSLRTEVLRKRKEFETAKTHNRVFYNNKHTCESLKKINKRKTLIEKHE